uniref:Myb/SANT-like DNA-binding domain-containing protein n=1 Tax=Xiphophorus couchianus TaxID=32473 RepID=A0A3B5LKQ7_9TELE
MESGLRPWGEAEVRALLCVWADRSVRERLKSTLRNKCIFQEMARQMQRKFGVVRNWKQCRTKYKNLKYDYKTAKSAHAAAGSGAGGPGRYMKFFEEVEAILSPTGSCSKALSATGSSATPSTKTSSTSTGPFRGARRTKPSGSVS